MDYLRLFSGLKNSDILISNIENYGHDWSVGYNFMPDVVVIPNKTCDIPKLLKLANEYKFPVTVRGRGTGTTGGALPYKGGVVLSLEKLNKIIEFDPDNAIIKVEPGVLTKDIHSKVESAGLFYPPDPASLDICSIGGNIAENAGGPRALKYGVTGEYVIGLSGYLPSGKYFSYGGKSIKDVAGYDLKKLLIGSEGTLAIITEIYLRLIPKPLCTRTLFMSFDSYDDAISILSIMKRSGIQPCIAEFMDPICIDAVSSYLNIDISFPNKAAHIIFQLDGNTEDLVNNDINRLLDLCEKLGSYEYEIVKENQKYDLLWSVRRAISPALSAYSPSKRSEDITVPVASIGLFLSKMKEVSNSLGLLILGYGHLGDGNIHVNFLQMDLSDDEWIIKKDKAIKTLLTEAVSMGGTITGEHGVGLTKKKYLSLMFSKEDVQLMDQIKLAFDPNRILNPGKIWDLDDFGS